MTMKKTFSFVLMAAMLLVSGNLAAANVAKIGSNEYATLNAAFTAAQDNDVIELIADVAHADLGVNGIRVTKNVTLDTKGFDITCSNGSNANNRMFTVYEGHEFTVENSSSELSILDVQAGQEFTTGADSKASALPYGVFRAHGDATNILNVIGTNKNIKLVNGKAWGLNVKSCDNSIVNLKDITIESVWGGGVEAEGGTINVENCVLTQEKYFDHCSGPLNASWGGTLNVYYSSLSTTNAQAESHCIFVFNSGATVNIYGGAFSAGTKVLWAATPADKSDGDEVNNNSIINVYGGTFDGAINQGTGTNKKGNYAKITIEGGLFSADPTAYKPEGYVVETVSQLGTNYYSVHKAVETSGSINDNEGENEDKAYKIASATSLTNETTKAQYVAVEGTSGAPATLTVGKDKLLEVGDGGLTVKDYAQVIVEVGGTLCVGNAGVVTAKEDNIIIKSDITGTGEFLIAPDVTFNTHPKATVQYTANVGKDGVDQYWDRIGVPVLEVETFAKSKDYPTDIQEWVYSGAGYWKSIYATEMKPFHGYTITHTNAREAVTYSFTGELVGNADSNIDFYSKGYNFFANSYVGYASAKEVLTSVMNDNNVQGTIWLWDVDNQQVKTTTKKEASEGTGDFSEVKPLQTFILQLRNVNEATVDINYREAIWANPIRRGGDLSSAPVREKTYTDSYAKIMIETANGQSDCFSIREGEEYSDAFDNGAEATKIMNKGVNLYYTAADDVQASIATNKVVGTKLNLKNANEVSYTMSFKHVRGTQFAIKDNLTGVVTEISEDNTYSFVAQPNATTDGRFEIVASKKTPTGIENIENTTTIQGIYTVMGQYIGTIDEWDALPQGMYVVDGQKLIK